MGAVLWVFLITAFALANSNHIRRTKLPYISDAVGNSLPPPSNVPATVGSPVNLLTPDRYEFYTFDESGELVKRLMTLEEIQAIVAAGEDTDGLVTFANDNQPTIAFNFTQPSQTKVHSVVTNVQNVLKAQMEAHKNKPNIHPTLDTPDVSDSWSLILPSIFGNTGVDIVPDKQTSGSFITPETETIDVENFNSDYESTQSKESNEIPLIPTSNQKDISNDVPNKEFLHPVTQTTTQKTSSTLTTTLKPVTTTEKQSPNTTTTVTSTTTTSTTTKQPITKTTSKIITSLPNSSTTVTIVGNSTTISPLVTSTSKTSTLKTTSSFIKESEKNSSNILNDSKLNQTSVFNDQIHYEKIGTFLPISTLPYIIEKTTKKPIMSTQKVENTTIVSENEKISTIATDTKVMTSTTSYVDSFSKYVDDKHKTTSTTAQSVSPSATSTTTRPSLMSNKLTSVQNFSQSNVSKLDQGLAMTDINKIKDNNENQSMIPLFDVAQSFNQIASDLGGSYAPLPTSNTLLDTTKISGLEVESKENLEIDIPTETSVVMESETKNMSDSDTFVKISTFDPHKEEESKSKTEVPNDIASTTTTLSSQTHISSTSPNIIDPIISESMGDLLSQVVHEGPDPTSIVLLENSTQDNEININTVNSTDSTTIQEMTSPETTTTNNLETVSTINPQIIPLIMDKTNTNNEPFKKPTKDVKENIGNNKNEDMNQQKISTIIKNNVSEIKINSKPTATNIKKDKFENNMPSINLTKIVSPHNNEHKKPIVTNNPNTIKKSNSSINTDESTTVENYLNNMQSTHEPLSSNKIPIIESGKVNNKIQKLNGSEGLPKVDEFKKKIQKVNIDDKELANERNSSWKLISTVIPPKFNDIVKHKHKVEGFYTPENIEDKNIVLEFPKENQGLEVTTKDLGDDVLQFTELCNELAFRYWNAMIENIDKKRSIVFSPYSMTSMLAMMFMGARGATSGEMNDVLKLDDMVTFNPHFTLKNISDSIETTSSSGVAISAFIRELYSERNKGKVLTFYKERAQHFYNGHVEEINFKMISDIIRRRTNLLVKRYTWGKIPEYVKSNSITMNPPLAAFSANIFYTDCTGSSVEGRDGEMYFVVSPNIRQRRLVPVPAVVYKSNFLAGYDPVLDATAAALGNTNSVVSTLFLMPGQQGNVVHGDDLENLEKRILESNPSAPLWNGLLRTLLPRVGIELQIPRFSHKSIFNVSSTLQKMGLKELFAADHADLGGLNGPSKDLYLSDMLQMTSFVTCGEGVIGEQHHIEEYPEVLDASRKRRTSRWLTGWDEPRDYQRAFHDPHDVGEAMHLPLHLRPRQARLPARSSQPARLKFDRPFLYFVRHNQSGMILYVGRYNPRLLP